ncbi:MAG TPA: carboxypeptidase-like regulatory domain-containing protein, partial [Gemmataceae bacterium]|nr:carboxypeptidase-like regulatory domain-containing protein [Gemmataceae bacterium]
MRVALAFVLFAGIAAFAQRPAGPADQGLIVGQVIDAGSGRPVAGAIVTILGSGGARSAADTASVLSTSDGRFFFRDLPSGTFGITATKMGYVDGAAGRRRPLGPWQPITLADGERVGDIVVRMWKCAAITGIVTDEMGEPVVGVGVRAFRRDFGGGRPRYIAGAPGAAPTGALTDDRGVYRLGAIVPGDYIVSTVGRPVSISVSMAQELQGRGFVNGTDFFPVALPGSATSTQVGNVVYDLGRGTAIPSPSRDGRLFVYPATFYPSVPTFPQAMVVSVGAGEERSAIDLQIHPLPTVRVAGTVIGPEGAASGVPLRMSSAASEDVAFETDVPTAITDRNGNFEFPAVPTGQYVIRASIKAPQPDPRMPLQPALSLQAPIAIGRADVEGLVLVLQQGYRVSGQFEFEGSAL